MSEMGQRRPQAPAQEAGRTQAFGSRGRLCSGPGPPGLRTVESARWAAGRGDTGEKLPQPEDTERRQPPSRVARVPHGRVTTFPGRGAARGPHVVSSWWPCARAAWPNPSWQHDHECVAVCFTQFTNAACHRSALPTREHGKQARALLGTRTTTRPQPAAHTSITWRAAGLSSGWPGSWAARDQGSGSSQRRLVSRCRRACTWARTGRTCPVGRQVCDADAEPALQDTSTVLCGTDDGVPRTVGQKLPMRAELGASPARCTLATTKPPSP